jgi:hypothetical protein
MTHFFDIVFEDLRIKILGLLISVVVVEFISDLFIVLAGWFGSEHFLNRALYFLVLDHYVM